MTQHLILVAFDGAAALRPLARLVDSYAPGAREWQGWTHELDEDRGVLRLTSPKQDASKIPEHLRGAAAEVVVFRTEIPLHRCAMTWAEIEPVEAAQDAATPAAAVAVQASTAPVQTAPVAPPTRRKLPPGARPAIEPPPSVINAAPVEPPPFGSALMVE